MGRPSVFTPEQDDIILSTTDSAVVNERFIALGYEPRTPGSIAARRRWLRKRGADVSPETPIERRLPKLAQHKEVLEAELARVNARREALLAELKETKQAIEEALVSLRDDLDRIEDEG